MEERYQLRHAAGSYWLLDTAQTGEDYIQPISFNEVGAKIWRSIEKNMNLEQIAEEFEEQYQITKQEALEDIRQFIMQLNKQGILLKELI